MFFLGFWFLYQLFEANFGLLQGRRAAAARPSSPTSAASSSASWWPGCWCRPAGSRARNGACPWVVPREAPCVSRRARDRGQPGRDGLGRHAGAPGRRFLPARRAARQDDAAGTDPVDAVRQLLAGPVRDQVRARLPHLHPEPHAAAPPELLPRGRDRRSRPPLHRRARPAQSLLARLSQLVRTLTAPQAATPRPTARQRAAPSRASSPGSDTSRPMSFAYLRQAERPRAPAAAGTAQAARPARQGRPAAADRARLPAQRRRPRPLRADDAATRSSPLRSGNACPRTGLLDARDRLAPDDRARPGR